MLKIRRYLILIFIIISSILAGCDEKKSSVHNPPDKSEITSKNIDNDKGYSIKNAKQIQFKVGEQDFKIVPIFDSLLEYIQKVKENPKEDYKDLYLSTVIEPFRIEAFGENGGKWLKDKINFAAPINIERLNESIQYLDGNYEYFISLVKESLEKSSNLLPGEKTTIYLFPFNPDQYNLIKQMSGVTAFATPNNSIILQIAPQKFTEEMLKYTLSHEYHHTVNFEKNGNQNWDLVDYVLSEGKADSFANLIFPNVEVPWTRELSEDEEQTIWNWLKERRTSFNETDLAEMRNGNSVFSYWSDYRIGYKIMQDYLSKNPDVPVEEWTNMNSEDILRKSNFVDK
nr:DUF2268 domain-containing protein [Heyndrickxia oleronia]